MDVLAFLKSYDIGPAEAGSILFVILMMLPLGIGPALQMLCSIFGIWNIVDGINNGTIFSTWADCFFVVMTPYIVYRTILDVRERLELRLGH